MVALDVYDSDKDSIHEYIEEMDCIMCNYKQYSTYPVGLCFDATCEDSEIIDFVLGVSQDYDNIVFNLSIGTRIYHIVNNKVILLPGRD